MSPEQRIKILRESGPNVWIAIDEDTGRVIGKGPTYEAAVAMAEQAGQRDPLVIKTPPTWEPMVL